MNGEKHEHNKIDEIIDLIGTLIDLLEAGSGEDSPEYVLGVIKAAQVLPSAYGERARELISEEYYASVESH